MELIGEKTYKLDLAGDEVEIGDLKAADFQPHIYMTKWHKLTGMKIWLPIDKKALPKVEGEKILWQTSDMEVGFYTKPPDEWLWQGALEMEIVLPKRKVGFGGRIEFRIEAPGLKFRIQQSLHPDHELWREDEFRHDTIPEMVNSIAVKSSSLGWNATYGFGKAFQILRPRATDARGDWIWGSWEIQAGLLIMLFDQKWLDVATYPVVIGPTFGNTGSGSFSLGIAADYIFGSKADTNPTGAGTGNFMGAQILSGFDAGEHFKMHVYRTSDAGKVTNANSDELTGPQSGGLTANFSTAPSFTAQNYLNLAWVDAAMTFMRDDGDANQLWYKSGQSYGDPWPATLTGGYQLAYDMCCYTDYTLSGVAQPMPILSEQGIHSVVFGGLVVK